MRKRIIGLMMLVSFSSVIGGGCAASLQQNIWRGFGESIGAVPAGFLVNFLATTFGINVTV